MTRLAATRSYHHGDVRNGLLNAARKLIRERRSTDFTMRELVDAIGVTQAAIYRHIEGKAELLATLCLDGFGLYEQAQDNALAKAGDDPWDRLMALGQAHFAFAGQHPDYFRVMFESRAANKREITPTVIPTFRRVVKAVEECQRQGSIGEGNPWDLAVTTWAVFHGLAALFLNGPLGDRPARAKRLERTAATVLERGMRSLRAQGHARSIKR
jgi:AcrR family transcriptional regulator